MPVSLLALRRGGIILSRRGSMKLQYIRLERPSTDSWMTYRLPWPMPFTGDEIDGWMEKHLPGWEVVSGCRHNPDYDDGEDPIPDFEPAERVMPPVEGDDEVSH
jgi:hypothetical protein